MKKEMADADSVPEGFRYRAVLLRGKPQHRRYDEFEAKHPKMPCSKRAKIFAPYDALKGFSEAVAAKNVLYVDPVGLEQQEQEELDRRLRILHDLTRNGRVSRENKVEVQVTFFEPCSDRNSEAFRSRGLYRTVTGICRNVDTVVSKTITLDDHRIPIRNVIRLSGREGLFE